MNATYTYWQDAKDGLFVGYWNEYPDYVTQGHDLAELQFMLRDIRDAIRDGDLQDTRRSVDPPPLGRALWRKRSDMPLGHTVGHSALRSRRRKTL